jgi:hypothetical protein
MAMRTARILARAWLALLVAVLPFNISCVALGEWRRTTSTPEPTPANTAPYEEHGQLRYAPPRLVTCHAAMLRALPVIWTSFLLYSIGVAIAANKSGAVGRRRVTRS